MKETFEKLDTDRSGTITLAEFRKELQENFKIQAEDVKEIFEQINFYDSGSTEEIPYSAFLAAAMQDRVKMHQQSVREAFARFDSGDRGYLTKDDLKKVLGSEWHGASLDEM